MDEVITLHYLNQGTQKRIPKVNVDTTKDRQFVIIRNAIATHAVNNDERRIPLQAEKLANGKYNLKIPENRAIVTLGNYYLSQKEY